MARKNLDKLMSERPNLSDELKNAIDLFQFADNEITQIAQMKQSSGWKIINKKVRAELHIRIRELIEPDKKIQALIALLAVADTKGMSNMLDDEIESILPE